MRRVRHKHSHIDKGAVASKLLQRLSGLETMDSDCHVIGGTEKLATVTGKFQ